MWNLENCYVTRVVFFEDSNTFTVNLNGSFNALRDCGVEANTEVT